MRGSANVTRANLFGSPATLCDVGEIAMFWIGLVAGLFVGVVMGVIIMAVLVAGDDGK